MARKASTAVAKTDTGAKPIQVFQQRLTLQRRFIEPNLPAHIPYEKFEASLMAAVLAKPDLMDTDPASLFRAARDAAELGLSLNPTLGEADILKVWNNKISGYESQFRPRYGGLMKLARQSGDVKKIEAHVVHKNDEFQEERGLNPILIHRPARDNPGPPTHVYCVWVLADGEKQFEVMTGEQVMAIKARSSSKTKDGRIVGPWVTDEEEMWRKTVVRRASKYMPRSAESFAKAVALDNLREAGVNARVEDGEVLFDADDITEAATQPATAAVQNLEEKVAAKKAEPAKDAAPAPEPLTKIVPAETEGGWDWNEWGDRAAAAAAACPKERREEWREMHKKALASAGFAEPDAAEKLEKALAS